MRKVLVLAIATGMVAVGVESVIAQKGKPQPPPSSFPGTVEFRCDADPLCTDGIHGDGSGYPGIGASETGSGAHLAPNSELWLGPGAAGHTLTLDFQGQSGQCNPICRWDWANRQTFTAANFEIQSNVVDGPNGALVTGGLRSLAIGEIGWSRLKVSFSGPDGFLYVLRFSNVDHPAATAVRVERTDACQWRFLDDGALASLQSGVQQVPRKGGRVSNAVRADVQPARLSVIVR